MSSALQALYYSLRWYRIKSIIERYRLLAVYTLRNLYDLQHCISYWLIEIVLSGRARFSIICKSLLGRFFWLLGFLMRINLPTFHFIWKMPMQSKLWHIITKKFGSDRWICLSNIIIYHCIQLSVIFYISFEDYEK